MGTIQQFCRQHRIAVKTKTAKRPDGDDWSPGTLYYRVELSRPRHKYSLATVISVGPGRRIGAPTAPMVLDCLLSDATRIEGISFKEWRGDPRKAEHTYWECQRKRQLLLSFLGDELYQELLATEWM